MAAQEEDVTIERFYELYMEKYKENKSISSVSVNLYWPNDMLMLRFDSRKSYAADQLKRRGEISVGRESMECLAEDAKIDQFDIVLRLACESNHKISEVLAQLSDGRKTTQILFKSSKGRKRKGTLELRL